MNVLSLFDGISVGRLALENAGIKADNYFSSEIDTHAIKVSERNYPDIIRLGNVSDYLEWDLPKIDLIIGGSPCQGFSKAGKMLNFDDPRSVLFFKFVEALEHFKPQYFMLENVGMKKEYKDVITGYMKVEPIEINSKLVSAQTRPRLYWTNIDVDKPEDLGITLDDVLDDKVDDKYYLPLDYFKGSGVHFKGGAWIIPEATKKGYVEVREGECVDLTFLNSKTRRGRSMKEKSNCLTAASFKYCKLDLGWFRMFTPIECERLQTLPDGFTEGVSDSQRYKMLGNGWTADVISHIFKGLK